MSRWIVSGQPLTEQHIIKEKGLTHFFSEKAPFSEGGTMKYIKWLICIILIFFIVLSTGEIYQINITEFPVKDMICIRLTDYESKSDFYSFVEKSAQKCGVYAYVCNIIFEPLNSKTTIYCSENAGKKILSENYFITSGLHKSIFLSDTFVEFKELKLYDGKEKEAKIFVLGNAAEKKDFVSSIKEKYDISSEYITRNNLDFYSDKFFKFQVAIWSIAFIFVFILGLYETALNKRKYSIKYSLGDSTPKLYFSSILIDTIVFCASFVLIIAGLYQFTYSIFSIQTSVVLFMSFLMINCVSQLSILKIDIRKAFSSNADAHSLLIFSYIFKTVCCLIAVIVGAVCFGIISESNSIKAQKGFFEKYSEYNYINMVPKDVSDPDVKLNISAVLNYKLALECKNDVLLQSVYSELKGSDGKKRDVIICGKSSIENIVNDIPEISKNVLTKNGITIIIPEYKGYKNDINLYKSLAQSCPDGSFGFYFAHNYENSDIGVCTYKNNTTFCALNDKDSGSGKTCKNPIIIFSNLNNEELAIENLFIKENDDGSYVGLMEPKYAQLQIYKISDDKLRTFAENNGFDLENDYFIKTNVYENYKATVQKYDRLSTIAILLFIVIMLIETIFVAVIVRMEYSVNAKEIAIKKILGYSIFQKNKQILSVTLIVYIAVIFMAAIINCFFELSDIRFVAIGCALQLCIEILVIFFLVIKTDKVKIIKILKGDSL